LVLAHSHTHVQRDFMSIHVLRNRVCAGKITLQTWMNGNIFVFVLEWNKYLDFARG
jgi:hypothetical protein